MTLLLRFEASCFFLILFHQSTRYSYLFLKKNDNKVPINMLFQGELIWLMAWPLLFEMKLLNDLLLMLNLLGIRGVRRKKGLFELTIISMVIQLTIVTKFMVIP